ncbi:MAG: hypothetical protein HYW65_01875 [Candidatus Liptonbacteria bacterium]|nr:hypothetical protein [Candidatus Liptonbacteria bacterium]
MKSPLSALALFLLASASWRTAAFASTINTNIPGTAPTTSPAGFVANFYQFALMLGGILAFGAIVYGAILYAVSAASPELRSRGKDHIIQALMGLALLMGAVLIINYVNPDIITHPPGTVTFTLKDVNLEGLKAKTGTPPAYNPSSIVDYNKLNEEAKEARREAQRLETRAADLRREALLLEEDALYDPSVKTRIDQLNKEAGDIERQLIGKTALAWAKRHDLDSRVALENNDPAEAARLRDARDRRLGTAAVNLNGAGDAAGAAGLLVDKFKYGVQFDADAAARDVAERMKVTGQGAVIAKSTAESQAKSVMEKIVTNAKTKAAEVEKISPGSGQKVRDEAKIAIDKIKTICAQNSLRSCAGFTYDPSK